MANSLKSKKLIIVISSPSGAGKSSICKQLLKDDPQLNISISDTTRPPRDNETNGTDYNFIEKNEFERRIKNNEYIEYANVFGNYYGSLHKDVQSSLNNGFDVFQFQKYYFSNCAKLGDPFIQCAKETCRTQ